MQVCHPEALDGIGGDCPDSVILGGSRHDCGDGATFDVPRARAEALADGYGVDVADIAAGDEPTESDDSGVCEVVKNDGEVCGRTKPCPYHS